MERKHAMRILGVDVGAKGGLAVIEGHTLLNAMRMPTLTLNGKQVIDAKAVLRFAEYYDVDRVVIEAVAARPAQGATSTFQFGRALGGVEAACQLLGAPMAYVTPAVWKKHFKLDSDKQKSIDAAHSLFGNIARELIQFKADDGLAEAALLALYYHLKG